MKELSLNLLDIVEHSPRAGASLVTIRVIEEPEADRLTLYIEDDGSGMSPELLEAVQDPFTTTRTTRKVGLGIPFLKEGAEMTGGSLDLWSRVGEGTRVTATYGYSHIDRPPLGDLAETVVTLVQCHDRTDFFYTHRFGDQEFYLDTRELREVMEGVPLSEPAVLGWIREFIKENQEKIYGGTQE